MDKKKTSYYYDEEIEQLIEEGIKLHENNFHDGKLTLTKFIDLCIRNAIRIYPEKIVALNKQIQELRKENDVFKSENKSLRSIITQDMTIADAILKQKERKQALLNAE